MIYNLGDHSLLFKTISIQLQNDFDATLTVSDEYTLELAKCIYRYLNEMYGSILAISNNETESFATYDLLDLVRMKRILSGQSITSIDNKDYDLNDDDIFDTSDVTMLRKYLLGVIDGDDLNPNPIGEKLIHVHAEQISRAYLDNAKLYRDITLDPSNTPLTEHIYDRLTDRQGYEYRANVESIDLITKYNIALWPISDNIIQYVIKDSVITPLSSLEDIAEMQKLLSNINSFNYDYNPGNWDYEFSKACYTIQTILRESNQELVCTGLCDLYVEKYLRSQNEIRSTGYGNN